MRETLTTEPACTTFLTFHQLVQQIKELDAPLRREQIERLIGMLVPTHQDYEEFIAIAEPYGRISVVRNEFGYAELLVMTWRKNQESVIHDHFRSACGIRVLQGTLTETLYENVRGNKARRLSERTWTAGEMTSSEANLDIHKVSNTNEQTLVTLHFYSVALDPTKMRRFIEVD